MTTLSQVLSNPNRTYYGELLNASKYCYHLNDENKWFAVTSHNLLHNTAMNAQPQRRHELINVYAEQSIQNTKKAVATHIGYEFDFYVKNQTDKTTNIIINSCGYSAHMAKQFESITRDYSTKAFFQLH